MGEGDVNASLLWDWFTKAENFLWHKSMPAPDMVKTMVYSMTSVHAIHWLTASGLSLPSMDWNTYKDQMCALFLPTDWEYTAGMSVLHLKQGSCPFMDFTLDTMGKNNLDTIKAGMDTDLTLECHRENIN
ncbi:hypothetical protein BDN71DRAFT_1508868 [Pleurotus eryngii]|uniref:Uncharacterized protein n=1 Tax=Pleurotus eryngii TaxID=5323 RepID=A0A9P5ZUX3_PLEER|nr:hypothetical protein BDN71DRAFT_1508868 [Pleurotus eryngii]